MLVPKWDGETSSSYETHSEASSSLMFSSATGCPGPDIRVRIVQARGQLGPDFFRQRPRPREGIDGHSSDDHIVVFEQIARDPERNLRCCPESINAHLTDMEARILCGRDNRESNAGVVDLCFLLN